MIFSILDRRILRTISRHLYEDDATFVCFSLAGIHCRLSIAPSGVVMVNCRNLGEELRMLDFNVVKQFFHGKCYLLCYCQRSLRWCCIRMSGCLEGQCSQTCGWPLERVYGWRRQRTLVRVHEEYTCQGYYCGIVTHRVFRTWQRDTCKKSNKTEAKIRIQRFVLKYGNWDDESG